MTRAPKEATAPATGSAGTPSRSLGGLPSADRIGVTAPADDAMRADSVACYFGKHQVLADVTVGFPQGSVTALIGPSGCGKSTFIRSLNRMHELVVGARLEGTVMLGDQNVYGRDADPVAVRRSVGMVFQRPNPFPTKSISENIWAGPKFHRTKARGSARDEIVERALLGAGLWDEVKNRLHAPAGGLSGGQQQRLCIARALAVEPEVLLLDEPCSALDPVSTLRIEQLLGQLRERLTIVIVTHNMQQAARVSDYTAFFTIEEEGEPGRLVEHGPTADVFANPKEASTEAYVTGRFG